MRNRVVIGVDKDQLAAHLLDGWHPLETWGVWSAAPMARLLIPLKVAHDSPEVTVRLTLVAPPAGGAYTHIRLQANGVELRPHPSDSAGDFVFSGQVGDGRPWLLIELCIDHLFTPANAGVSIDQRALGIGLKRVEVELDEPVEATMRAEVTWVPASDLVLAERMDIVVKARFFNALATGLDVAAAREAYLRHIDLRTGGCEPADYTGKPSTKCELADYELACRALLMSMQRDGFDPSHAVPLGRNGRPLNGAHRIACALALNHPVAVTREALDGGSWDMAWFERHGYSKRERLRLLFDLVRLAPERCSVFALWAHGVDVWDDMVSQIRSGGYAVAGWVDLAWPEEKRPAFESLVFDIYSHGITDFVQGFGHIDRKLDFLRLKPCFLRVGVCLMNAEAGASWAGLAALKTGIRQTHAARVPVDQFVTCHFGDSISESQHLARTLLLPENLDALLSRRTNQPRAQFLTWLNAYAATLQGLGLDAYDCCIVGSAGLEIQGTRLATDIDFTVRDEIRQARFTHGITRFDSGIDLVTRGYHRNDHGPTFTDDEVIGAAGLHVYFRGFKVVAPKLVRDRKAHSRRAKDLLDVELMSAIEDQQFASGT